MNVNQKRAVFLGGFLVAAFALFPPWQARGESAGLRFVGAGDIVWRKFPITEERWVDTGERVDTRMRPEFLDELRGKRGPTEQVQVDVESRKVRVSIDHAGLAAITAAVLAFTVAAVWLLRDKEA